MENENVPVIVLKSYRIDELHYARLQQSDDKILEGFNIQPEVGISEDQQQGKLQLVVTLRLDDEDEKFIKVEISAIFSISAKLDTKDEIAKTLLVNGTAMVYPYVRSVVSMTTGLDSAQTVLLPTLNTQALFGSLTQDQENSDR